MVIPTIENGIGVGAEQLTADIATDLVTSGVENRKVERRGNYVSPLEKLWTVRDTRSKTVGGAAVDALENTTQTADDYEAPSSMTPGASVVASLEPLEAIFQVGDTVMVPGTKGYKADGVTQSNNDLMLLVMEVTVSGIDVKAINGKKIGSVMGCVPDIAAGSELIRMAPALSDTNESGPKRLAIPKEVAGENYCQKFSVTVDVDDDALRSLEQRGVDWGMADMVASAKSDLLRSRDLSFLFGVKTRLWDGTENILTCDGIVSAATGDVLDLSDGWMKLIRSVFTGAKVKKGTLLVSTGGLSCVLGFSGSDTVKLEGMTLKSPYGSLKIVHWPLLDGTPAGGVVILDGALEKWEYDAPNEEWSAGGTCYKLSECSCVTVDPKGVFLCTY